LALGGDSRASASFASAAAQGPGKFGNALPRRQRIGIVDPSHATSPGAVAPGNLRLGSGARSGRIVEANGKGRLCSCSDVIPAAETEMVRRRLIIGRGSPRCGPTPSIASMKRSIA
jgi:hypothetical protein